MLSLKQPGEFLLKQILAEAQRQGHTLTGKLAREARVVTYGNPLLDDLIGVQVLLPPYATQLDKGVKPGRVPFASSRTRNRSRGGTSAYIEALMDFFKRRYPSSSTARAKELAIRTAKVARRTGHPTPGSFKYSTNNARLGFIEKSLGTTSIKVLESKMAVRPFVEDNIKQKLTALRVLTTGRNNG